MWRGPTGLINLDEISDIIFSGLTDRHQRLEEDKIGGVG